MLPDDYIAPSLFGGEDVPKSVKVTWTEDDGWDGFARPGKLDRREEWQRAYPEVDVLAALDRMNAWLVANPKKRPKIFARFIVNWLASEQRDNPGEKVARPSADEIDKVCGFGKYAKGGR